MRNIRITKGYERSIKLMCHEPRQSILSLLVGEEIVTFQALFAQLLTNRFFYKKLAYIQY